MTMGISSTRIRSAYILQDPVPLRNICQNCPHLISCQEQHLCQSSSCFQNFWIWRQMWRLWDMRWNHLMRAYPGVCLLRWLFGLLAAWPWLLARGDEPPSMAPHGKLNIINWPYSTYRGFGVLVDQFKVVGRMNTWVVWHHDLASLLHDWFYFRRHIVDLILKILSLDVHAS